MRVREKVMDEPTRPGQTGRVDDDIPFQDYLRERPSLLLKMLELAEEFSQAGRRNRERPFNDSRER